MCKIAASVITLFESTPEHQQLSLVMLEVIKKHGILSLSVPECWEFADSMPVLKCHQAISDNRTQEEKCLIYSILNYAVI